MSGWCARPGCHRSAAARFGFDSAAQVVWIDALPGAGNAAGELCTRHADRMVLPRGWELRDLRPPPPPASDPPAVRRPAPRRTRRRPPTPDARQPTLALEPGPIAVGAAAAADPSDDADPAWTPRFDPADDADGLLVARTPLLARAFRGD